MKVMCIDAGRRIGKDGNMLPMPPLKEGCVYTVIKITKTSYFLKEADCYPYNGFKTDRFIPLSTIDEMELLEQRQTELV